MSGSDYVDVVLRTETNDYATTIELEAQLRAALELVNKWSWNKKDRKYSEELLAAIKAAKKAVQS